MACSRAQPEPRRQVRQFDDDAVDLVAEAVAATLHLAVIGEDVLDRFAVARLGRDAQAPLAQHAQLVERGCDRHGVLRVEQVVEEHVEAPARSDARIELADRTRGRVARVREQRLPFLLEIAVEALEVPGVHDRLAPRGEHRGHWRIRTGVQAKRNGADRLHVLCDALAPLAVTARGHAIELPVDVDRLDRQPVELGLDQVADARVRQRLPDPLVEPADFVRVGDRFQADHRRQVADLRERRQHAAAHALRRRVRRHQVREGALEPEEILEQGVVGRVRDLRPIQHVVRVLVTPQLAAQLLDAPPRLVPRHAVQIRCVTRCHRVGLDQIRYDTASAATRTAFPSPSSRSAFVMASDRVRLTMTPAAQPPRNPMALVSVSSVAASIS